VVFGDSEHGNQIPGHVDPAILVPVLIELLRIQCSCDEPIRFMQWQVSLLSY
jgi:hypothetical protein